MNWIPLREEAQLPEIIEQSKSIPVVIFKHSTRCGTSSLAKNRLERGDALENVLFYYLDVISCRPLSKQVAGLFEVAHASPQVLLIRDGICIYNESHYGVRMEDIVEQIA